MSAHTDEQDVEKLTLAQVDVSVETEVTKLARERVGKYVLPPDSSEPLLVLGVVQKPHSETEVTCMVLLLGVEDVTCSEFITWPLVE